jgi:hypothetical protein
LASTISPRFDQNEAIPVPSKRRGFEGGCHASSCRDGSLTDRIALTIAVVGAALPMPVAADSGTIEMTRERLPLWVWITVVLLALGSLIYVVVFYAAEYLMTFF